MTNEQFIEKTAKFVKTELFDESSGHDWWHVCRVWQMSRKICAIEGGDPLVVELTALLHDISDYKLNGGDELAAPRIARKWLTDLGVTDSVVLKVSDLMGSLGFLPVVGAMPPPIEGKIVLDADRLDAIGAIGIARAFAYGGFKGHAIYQPSEEPREYQNRSEYLTRSSSSVNHFYEKLLLLKDKMHTETARQIATRRHRVLENYLEEFFREWTGDDLR